MAIVFACGCGKQFSVDDSKAGKRGRCSACGSEIVIPVVAEMPTQIDEIITVVRDTDDSPPPPPLPRPAAFDSSPIPRRYESSQRSVGAETAVEPWYFAFLVFVGYSYVVIGIGQFAVVVCYSLILCAKFIELGVGSAILIAAPFFVGSGLLMCTLLFFGGLILLAVDAGRNLRAMRWRA